MVGGRNVSTRRTPEADEAASIIAKGALSNNKLLTFLHMAFPVGSQYLFMDGWLGAWNPTIKSVIVEFPSNQISSGTIACAYFDREDLDRVRKKAAKGLLLRGYRMAIKLPEIKEQPKRVVLVLEDGRRLAQNLTERYNSLMEVNEKLDYLQSTPYPIKGSLLENQSYVETVLRICTSELSQNKGPSMTTHTEQICCTEGGLVFISGWMRDGGRVNGQVTAKDLSTHKSYEASILRFHRDDLLKLRNNSVGFGLFLAIDDRRLPARLDLEIDGVHRAEIQTGDAPVVSGRPALTYSLSVLRLFLTTGVSRGFDPENPGQKSVLIFISSLVSQMTLPARLSADLTWGEVPDDPDLSLIIPVYESYQFVRNQLLDFANDDYVMSQEIIYVLDSVADTHWFINYMDQLWELYRVPCRVLVMENRSGFSGACNCGASAAKAPRILFLNQDVLLQTSGSLARMVETLDSDQNIGCVGARLLYPDGSIQHMGMTWKRNPTLGGLRLNHHIYKGIDPSCVDISDAVDVPAVTGACLLCRKDDFEKVGRFDSTFILGDFEDSDLCLRVRQLGMRVVCDNKAVFIHAEGASYPSEERQATITYNALRHEQKWHREISQLLADPAFSSEGNGTQRTATG